MTGSETKPRDFKGLRDLIVERRDRLPKRLAQVAAFAVANPQEIAFGTTAEIARDAGVQPSTLVRFAQALGYQGFSELQSVFRDRLRDRFPDYAERLAVLRARAPDSRAAALFEGFCDAADRSVAALRNGLDPVVLDRALGLMAGAETIYLVGRRRSFPIVSYLAYAFGRLGVRFVLVGSEAGIEPEMLSAAAARDVVLAVSFTPYAPLAVALAADAAGRGLPVIAITDSPFSPIAQNAAAVFEVIETDFEGFRSLTATFTLVQSLAVGVASQRGAERRSAGPSDAARDRVAPPDPGSLR